MASARRVSRTRRHEQEVRASHVREQMARTSAITRSAAASPRCTADSRTANPPTRADRARGTCRHCRAGRSPSARRFQATGQQLRLPTDRRATLPRGDGGQPQAGAPADARCQPVNLACLRKRPFAPPARKDPTSLRVVCKCRRIHASDRQFDPAISTSFQRPLRTSSPQVASIAVRNCCKHKLCSETVVRNNLF